MTKLVYVAVATANTLLALAWPMVPRLHRLARSIMFIAHFRNVQKIFGDIMEASAAVAKSCVILVLHLTIHSVFAFMVFGGQSFDSCSAPRERHYCSPFTKLCTDYFATFFGSVNQLFIVLTTANFPVRTSAYLQLTQP